MHKVRRLIRYFDKKADPLLGEIDFPEVSLRKLQQMFNIPESNPMYDCYIIEGANAEFFMNLTGKKFDLEKYVYFLECDAIEE